MVRGIIVRERLKRIKKKKVNFVMVKGRRRRFKEGVRGEKWGRCVLQRKDDMYARQHRR